MITLTPQSDDEAIAALLKDLNYSLDQFWQDLGQSGSFAQYVKDHLPNWHCVVVIENANGEALKTVGTFDARHLRVLFPGNGDDARDKRWRVKLARSVSTAMDEIQAFCRAGEYLVAWRTLAEAQSLALSLSRGGVDDITRAADRLLSARHKDNRADKVFIQGWYRENRAQFPSKDAAATHAAENRLVPRTWRVIRGYLNNV